MQLNCLTTNSDTASTQKPSTSPIYDHKLARIQTEIFILGKKHSFQPSQSQIYKFNVYSNLLQPVYTFNSLGFEDFSILSYHQKIYFLGKSSVSQNLKLYYFEENKLVQAQQKGNIPKVYGKFTFSFFSDQYLIFFGAFNRNKVLNEVLLFDIQQLTWKQVVTTQKLPICQFFSMIRVEGRIYLLNLIPQNLQYSSKTVNTLYELKINGFERFFVTFQRIQIQNDIKDKFGLQKVIGYYEKKLLVLGRQRRNITLDEPIKKYIISFNLETFEWEQNIKEVQLQNYPYQCIQFQSKLFFFGNLFYEELINNMHVIQLEQTRLFPYEQTSCYYCQQTFTYRHIHSQEPIIQIEQQQFAALSKIQNKALKKLSNQIINEFKAIQNICEFLILLKASQIKISLRQSLGISCSKNFGNKYTEDEFLEMLCFQVKINRKYSKDELLNCFQAETEKIVQKKLDQVFEMVDILKASVFRLGVAVLFIFKTTGNETLVLYFTFSQTNLSQNSFSSPELIWYTVQKIKEQLYVSSTINRHIIFQNVKSAFKDPEQYEFNYFEMNNNNQNQTMKLYVLGVNKLQKTFNNGKKTGKIYQDIRIKGNYSKSSLNSLQRYLRIMYLSDYIPNNYYPILYLEGEKVEKIKLLKQFKSLQSQGYCKRIKLYQERHIKSLKQSQQTHFSTLDDQALYFKSCNLLVNCQIYLFNQKKSKELDFPIRTVYFFYQNRLLKVHNTPKQIIGGFIEINKDVEIDLFMQNIQNKKERKQLQLWLKHLQNFCSEQ